MTKTKIADQRLFQSTNSLIGAVTNFRLLARNEIFSKPITIIYLRPILVDVLKAKLLKFVPPSTQKILDIDMKLASYLLIMNLVTLHQLFASCAE